MQALSWPQPQICPHPSALAQAGLHLCEDDVADVLHAEGGRKEGRKERRREGKEEGRVGLRAAEKLDSLILLWRRLARAAQWCTG